MSWYVKSVDDLHPPLELKPNEVVALGRLEDTGVKDKSLSRHQILLKYQPAKNNVICKHLGEHPSFINEVEITKDKKVRIGMNSKIQLLRGRYLYQIVPGISSELKRKMSSPTKPVEEMQAKKQKPNPSQKGLGMSRKFKEFLLDKLNCTPDPRTPWNISPNIITYTPPGCSGSSKIAAFDLDHTLIKTKSGRVFPRDKDDWEVMWPGRVLPKLKSISKDGYKVVLITNQSGIESRKITIAEFQEKAEAVISNLGVPVQILASPRNSVARKPIPGLWAALESHYNGGVEVDLRESYYVGDAAGRDANPALKRKKDFSASDREFASNIGVRFFTPEEFFLKEEKETTPWSWSCFDPQAYCNAPPPVTEDAAAELAAKVGQDAILFVGFPGSGKSSFCSRHLPGYVRVNMDDMKSHKKCLEVMEAALARGDNIVVDNTFPDVTSRQKYLSVIQKFGKVQVRCFVMATSLEHAKHNNRYRRIINGTEEVPPIAYNTYKSRYTDPSLSEGFSHVIRVNFVPEFTDEGGHLTEFYFKFLGK